MTAKIRELNAKEVVDVLMALVKLGQHTDEVLDAVQNRVLAVMHDFTARQISNTLWAIGAIGRCRPGR